MKTEKIIYKSYKLLRDVTPINADCGNLCSGECCKGDNKTGMILFPCEEKLFENNPDYKVIKTSDNKNLVICNGKCNRETRPLSCRIFPLVPVFVDGKIYVIDDPRATGICPLLYDEIPLDKKFEKSVYKFGKLLMRNSETFDFLERLTEEITEILSLKQNLLF